MSTAVAPSGDETGETDVAAINAVLSAPGECVLKGRYFIASAILMSSNTTLTLTDATVLLVDGANDNIVRNTDQSAGGAGNENLRITGTGLARFRCNPLAQAGGRGQGLLFQNVTGLRVSGVTIGPTFRAAAMQYGVRHAEWSDIELAQDVTTPNQDGIDSGPGCRDIRIEGIRGRTGDDCFSIFAKNTGGNTTAYTNGLSPADRRVEGIYISNVTVNVGISPVRVQAGDGSTLSRVYVSNFTNTRPTTAAVTGGPCGVLQFGSTKYVTTEPDPSELREIYLDGYTGPGTYLIGAESNFSRIGVNNVTLSRDTDAGKTTKAAVIGTGRHVDGFAPRFSEVTVSGVTVLAAETAANVLSLPSGSSMSSVELVDVAAVPAGSPLTTPAPASVTSIDVSIGQLKAADTLDVSIGGAADALPSLGSVSVRLRAPGATRTG